MSENVTNEQLINAMTSNREAVLNRISSIESKIDKFQESQHNIDSRLLLAEDKIANNAKDINANWEVTRKLDNKVTRWGGIITACLFIFGVLLKFTV